MGIATARNMTDMNRLTATNTEGMYELAENIYAAGQFVSDRAESTMDECDLFEMWHDGEAKDSYNNYRDCAVDIQDDLEGRISTTGGIVQYHGTMNARIDGGT